MGIFTRKNPYEQEVAELEALQRAQQRARAQQALPSAPISAPSPMLASQPSFTAPAPAQMVSAPPPAAQKIAYGIEDVIRLMRDLPNGQQDAVVSIVQKTLMSMKVDISSILEDAARKIERLNKKNGNWKKPFSSAVLRWNRTDGTCRKQAMCRVVSKLFMLLREIQTRG
jgi:hypothetical protein